MSASERPAAKTKARAVDLTQGSVGKHMRSLGTFLAFGTVAIFCTSMVDVYFVSKLGAHALAALSFTFPVYLIVTAFSSGLGNGVVAVIARAVGGGDRTATKELGTDALLLTVSMGVLISVAGLTTIHSLFRALGADEGVLALIEDYMHVWYLGVVLVIFPQVSQTIARAHGDARTPTFFMWAMSITNMALDPLFIFGWGPIPALGLRGAAFAAIAARAVYVVGMTWLLIYGLDALAPIRLSIARLRNSWKRLLHVGLPAIATQMVQPFSTALLTRIVAMSGSLAVAAFGVGSRIEMVTAIYLWAVAGALPPFVGQNAGAGRMDRVRSAIGIAIKFCIGAGIVLFAVAMIAGNEIVGYLTSDVGESSCSTTRSVHRKSTSTAREIAWRSSRRRARCPRRRLDGDADRVRSAIGIAINKFCHWRGHRALRRRDDRRERDRRVSHERCRSESSCGLLLSRRRTRLRTQWIGPDRLASHECVAPSNARHDDFHRPSGRCDAAGRPDWATARANPWRIHRHIRCGCLVRRHCLGGTDIGRTARIETPRAAKRCVVLADRRREAGGIAPLMAALGREG